MRTPSLLTIRRALFGLYLLTAVFVTVQQGIIKHSNNFKVFRSSAENLAQGRDLYALHPDQHFDLYKYSPTFAVLFAPLARLPFAVALLVWSLLNAFALWYALSRLLPERQSTAALALVYFELLFSMQYTQSNPIVTALIILTFVWLERGAQLRAAFAVALGACVKIFPLAALSFALFHPRRIRFGLRFVAIAAALLALPLLVEPFHQLVAQYRSWGDMQAADARDRGYAVMQYLNMVLGVQWPNWAVQLAGVVLLLLPVALRRSAWAQPEFRRLFLCSLLVFVVIFNHESERASFVIAYTGVVVWYAGWPRTRLRDGLMAFAFLVMLVNSVEVVPRSFKVDFLIPYRIKGIPYLVMWVVMQAELLGWPRGLVRRLERPQPAQVDAAPMQPSPG